MRADAGTGVAGMHAAAVERLTSELRQRGLTAALISNPATLTWLSGYAAPIQFGPSPFEGRAALGLCDLGQLAVREGCRAGRSELELWVAAKGQIELEAGTRLACVADLVAGAARTAELGGPPSTYVLREGDPVIFDVAPRL